MLNRSTIGARAPEYDEWMNRIGRYSRGPEADTRWFDEFGIARQRLREFKAGGDVLEIACGTGLSTAILSKTASHLVAVDARGLASHCNGPPSEHRRLVA